MITGGTRVAAVIGDPVRHSLSPAMHNAAYRALDLDWVYVAFEVPPGGAADALVAVRALGLVGLSVTMPHKEDVAARCDTLSDDAAVLRSANTVTRTDDGTLLGSSTDGDGFLRSVRDAGHDIEPGVRVLLVGAGGAARAVALALGRRDARVCVTARRTDAARAAAALAGGDVVAWDDRADAAAVADVIVNATPLGMGADRSLPVPAAVLRPTQLVADLVYHPLETPLLSAAAGCGAATVDGLGMLAHQAALQVETWSGHAPPIAVMRAAAQSELGKLNS